MHLKTVLVQGQYAQKSFVSLQKTVDLRPHYATCPFHFQFLDPIKNLVIFNLPTYPEFTLLSKLRAQILNLAPK